MIRRPRWAGFAECQDIEERATKVSPLGLVEGDQGAWLYFGLGRDKVERRRRKGQE